MAAKEHSAASRNQQNCTTAFTDFTDLKLFRIFRLSSVPSVPSVVKKLVCTGEKRERRVSFSVASVSSCLKDQKNPARKAATKNELTTKNAKIAKKNAYDFALHDFAFPLCVLCVLCG